MAEANEKSSSPVAYSMPSSIATVAIKLPDFNARDPKMWIRQAEAQFDIGNITREQTQFHHLLARLPYDVIDNCRDVLKDDFKPGALKLLKDALISRYQPTRDQRIKEVLDNSYFDQNELPSVFFRRMCAVADDALPYDIIIQRFRDRLPDSISIAIASLINKINKTFEETKIRSFELESTMLEVADMVHAITPKTTVFATEKKSNQQKREKSKQRSRSKSRGRNPTNSGRFREDGAWCRNHFMYRDETRKCSRPGKCTYRSNFQRSVANINNNEQQQQQSKNE